MISITDAGYTIAFISIMLSATSAFVRRVTVDQNKVKDAQRRMKEHQKEMQEAQKKGQTEKMMKAQGDLTKAMTEQMTHSFKPLIITMIPFILIFGWLKTNYDGVGTVATLFDFDLGWFWWYFLISLMSSMLINKIAKVT